ncbi:MAG: D-alanyl-D-alanine carboxypeptidase [Paracoccus sp. (in: a-proteobacteria)]|uniref:D-alanyl-D-alanine carboxypeptidase n=1 Tax=unclassified Paracoccus (in: a-proteobacteria) TaxID=2688777 RepID=UPI0025DAD3C7|nr:MULTISPECIES: D-alanyl-D-alanine carboxypeptidase [unclassified Paracoccus (in: a-proteobacteria)]
MTGCSSRRGLLAGIAALCLARTARAETPQAARPPARPLPDAAQLIRASGLAGTTGYALVDPLQGRIMAEGGAAMPFSPASTMKAITALYALDRLGQTHRFRTRVLRADDMLILAGGGDPVLSSDDLDRLAADLVAAGAATPARFAVWGGALPQIEEIAPPQADWLAYNPALSGMILNFNRVYLNWRRADGRMQMSLKARAERHSPRAYTITVAPGDQPDLFSYRSEDGIEAWTVSRAAIAQPGSRWLPVRKPELYAGDVFQTLCRARGLVLPRPDTIRMLPVAEEVAALDSPPLITILRDMLYYSTNLTAEVVGLQASGAPDTASSARAMQDWLATKGQGAGFQLRDHSGLSDDSRVTARGMALMLAGPGLAAGLPELLKTDPLAEDLGLDPDRSAQVAAKTGTLNFVSNLAGYVTGADGNRRCFAILSVDPARHEATSGQEQPAGVRAWTRDAKRLQRQMLQAWAGSGG